MNADEGRAKEASQGEALKGPTTLPDSGHSSVRNWAKEEEEMVSNADVSSIEVFDNDAIVDSERYQRLLEAVKNGEVMVVQSILLNNLEEDITPLLRAHDDLVCNKNSNAVIANLSLKHGWVRLPRMIVSSLR